MGSEDDTAKGVTCTARLQNPAISKCKEAFWSGNVRPTRWQVLSKTHVWGYSLEHGFKRSNGPHSFHSFCFLSRCLLGLDSAAGRLHGHTQPYPHNIYGTVICARCLLKHLVVLLNWCSNLVSEITSAPYPTGEDVWSGAVQGIFMGVGATGLGWDIRTNATRFRKRRDGQVGPSKMEFRRRRDWSQECNDMNRVSSLEADSVLMLYGATSLSPHNDSVR